MTENPSDIFSSRSCPNLEDHLFCTKIKFYRFSRMKKKQAKQSNLKDSQKQKSPSSQSACRPPLPQPKIETGQVQNIPFSWDLKRILWEKDKKDRRTLEHPIPTIPRRWRHIFREREGEIRNSDRRRRQAKKHFGVPQSEFGGGHSNNDSIHSFTPIHLPTYYTHHTLLIHSTTIYIYLHTVYFPRQTNHAPSLAHNHSTFMEMCVIADRFHKKKWSDTTKQTNGVWCRHPSYTLLLIHFTNASVRRLCLTTTITLGHVLHTSNKITWLYELVPFCCQSWLCIVPNVWSA